MYKGMITRPHSVDHSDIDYISRLTFLEHIRVVLISKCLSLFLSCD